MLLDKEIVIEINPKNDRTYYKLGYYDINSIDITQLLFINIKIEDLNHTSKEYVNVKCDICGDEKKIQYYNYWKNIKKHGIYTCNQKCAQIKNKKTNLKRYNTESILGDKGFIEKGKQTLIERYGVDNAMKNENIKEKSKKTLKERYGVEVPMKNIDIKNKQQQTMKERYGKKHALQVDEFLSKSVEKQKNKSEEEKFQINKKREITTLKNYGVNNIANSSYLNNKKFKKLKAKYSDYNILSSNKKEIEIKCDCGHTVVVPYSVFYNRVKNKANVCTECFPINSKKSGMEFNFREYIYSIYDKDKILINKRFNRKELDIYIPDKNLAIEINGLYWHSEEYKPNNYHLEKTELCENMNIQLLHIYEDDWLYKTDIVKSIIKSKLNIFDRKIYARKTVIKILQNFEIKDFLNNNHIQGYRNSDINLGLYYGDELVSLMSFNSRKIKDNISDVYELTRYCNIINTQVIGGASKLFSYFIKKYNFKNIYTVVDRSLFNGYLYKKLNFLLINKTKPDFSYIINSVKEKKFKYRKNKLVSDGFDKNKTEHEIMLERGFFRIYDSGTLNFIFSK
jgi:hypothetical protein